MAENDGVFGSEELKFKGKPVLKLYRVADLRYQFFFGVAKAKLIMGNIGAIQEFIEKNDKE